MTKHTLAKLCLAVSVFCFATISTAMPARAQEGLGERLGAQLDQGLDQLGNELRQGWASLRQTVDKMGVQGRVYSRLRWDKQVASAKIEIDAEEGGVVTLRGEVRDAAAKQKAVQLAEDTVGVTRVIDELSAAVPQQNPAQ